MSAKQAKRRSRQASDDSAVEDRSAPSRPLPPPIKPHSRLLVFLLLAWVAWIVVLLLLFFKTVYPHRDMPQQLPHPSAPF